MPGRSKKANAQEHHNVESMNSAPSTSLPTYPENAGKTPANDAQHSLGGFLKKQKQKRNSSSKKKGDSEIVEQNFQNLYVYFILFKNISIKYWELCMRHGFQMMFNLYHVTAMRHAVKRRAEVTRHSEQMYVHTVSRVATFLGAE